MIVVGIDPSLTSTGIAILDDGKPTSLRAIGHHTPNGKTYAHRSDRIVSQARAVTRHIADIAIPDLAVIEGPAYAHANAYTHDSAGLWWGIFSTLRAWKTPTAVVAPKTRALFATGNGNADKAAVQAAMRNWYDDDAHRITGHDIADALALAAMGAHRLGDTTHAVALKPRQIDALDVVKWPALVEVNR